MSRRAPRLTDEPLVFTRERHSDSRGSFEEIQRSSQGMKISQVNLSHNLSGVLRGLHIQIGKPQGKFVTCVRGTIFDAWIDCRKDSKNFGKSGFSYLDSNNPKSVWIPPGFAHGYFVLSDFASVLYQCSEEYDPECDRGIIWSDRQANIDWPFRRGLTPLLSDKDRQLPSLAVFMEEIG